MQGVVKLTLEAPFELRVVKVAGMEIKVISMNWGVFVFELDDDLDAFAFLTCGEVQQGMFVEAQLRQDALEAGINRFWHGRDCIASSDRAGPTCFVHSDATHEKVLVPFS